MKIYHFTKEGYAKLTKEKETLLSDRPRVVADLKRARELGDLSENGFYKSTKMRLNQIDHRLFRLSAFLKYGKIIEKSYSDTVQLGSTVTLSDGKSSVTYTIVGSEEANPREGKISDISPLGKTMIGKKAKQQLSVNTTTYTIEKIS